MAEIIDRVPDHSFAVEELDEIFDSPKPVKASLLARNYQHKPSDLTKPQDLEKAATGAPLQVAVSGGP